MKNKDFFIGLFLGVILSSAGFAILVYFLTAISSFADLKLLLGSGFMGKFITLGSIPNLVLFFFLLNKGKDAMAKGVILAMVLLAIFTFVIQLF